MKKENIFKPIKSTIKEAWKKAINEDMRLSQKEGELLMLYALLATRGIGEREIHILYRLADNLTTK